MMPLSYIIMRPLKSLLPDTVKLHIKKMLGVPNMEATLLNMKQRGFSPQVVLDVGAFRGDWTLMCKRLFPTAHVLMIEPQLSKKNDLEHVMAEYNNVDLVSALLGRVEQRAVGFYELESASSVLPETEKVNTPTLVLPMTTLDAVTEDTIFAKPDFIKLDVQGYELEVLQGGLGALSFAEVILMEVNLIEIYKGAPLFHEVVQFMSDRGFLLHEVCSFIRRPYDGALWQMDVIFVGSSSPLVSSKRWS